MLKYTDFYKDNFKIIESYNLTINYKIDKNEKIENNKKDNDSFNQIIYFDIKISTEYLNGLIRGLETLSQILNFSNKEKVFKLYNFPIEIHDYPSFGYRGIMIDTSRHFISPSKIKEILDGMLFTKLNILHWHLTDDEYFSLNFEGENNPEIEIPDELKDYSYGRRDIKDILEYAYFRGVTIIPEIDNPAHSRSWQFKKDLNITYNKNEVGILNPSNENTFKIIEEVIFKVADYFEIYSNLDYNGNGYLHLGGDEIVSSIWDTNEIQEYMKYNNITSISDLENFFFNKVYHILDERIKNNLVDRKNNKERINPVEENIGIFADNYAKDQKENFQLDEILEKQTYLSSFETEKKNKKSIYNKL